MKYTRAYLLIIPILLLSFAIPVFAETPTVSVPENCSVAGSGGTIHEYSGKFLAICALVAARTQGAVSSYTLAYDDAFGFYLLTINGITPGSTEYWALYLNGAYANDGLSSLSLANGDVLSFQLTDWSTNTDVGSPVAFTVSLQGTKKSDSSGGGQIVVTFDIPAAITFLTEKQKTDGSFGTDLITDWAAIALASADTSHARDLVRTYMLTHTPSVSSITDYERHAMALMALDINPYTETGVDYITPIVNSYDGTQIGDSSLINDDIFALFPLPKSGYGTETELIQHTIAFIIGKQGEDGAWEKSVDLTAAAIQALSPFTSIKDVSAAIEKAKVYLSDSRQPNGNWKNSYEASWIVQALHATKVSLSSWIQDSRSPMSTLASAQEKDGGVEPMTSSDASRTWATAYAIPAALGKTWNDILHTFPKPTIPVVAIATTTVATVPEEPVATSTKEVVEENLTPTRESAEIVVENPAPSITVPESSQNTDSPEMIQTSEQEIVADDTVLSSQAAAVGAVALPDTAYLLILPLLLIVAAFLSAIAFGPLQRFISYLFRKIFGL